MLKSMLRCIPTVRHGVVFNWIFIVVVVIVVVVVVVVVTLG